MLSFLTWLSVFKWTDVLEIALLVGVVYSFGLWLKRDRSRRLLNYFYVACGIFLLAVLLDLPVVLAFYKAAWPIMVVLFIVLHQKSLQQNYVAARTIEADTLSVERDWLHVVMRAAFKALQRKKNLFFVIEGKQAIRNYCTTPLVLQSPVQQNMLDMIIESTIIEDNSLVLLNQLGNLVALNGQWIMHEDLERAVEHEHLPLIQRQALFLTSKTDVLVFFAEESNKLLTIMAQGTIVKNLTSDKAELIINQYLRKQRWINQPAQPAASKLQKSLL